jgi:hypothetical protein
MRMKIFRSSLPAFVLALGLCVSGCFSHHISSLINNQTGGVIHQVEIDYPSASFGIDKLDPGQIYPYKFQVRGKGPVKVQYTDASGKQIQHIGTIVSEGDQGEYLIILLPDEQVKWVPSLNNN